MINENVSQIKRIVRRFNIRALSKFPIGEIKVDLGCGDKDHWRKDEERLGIDVMDYGQDITWDVEEGIPLPDNSCSYIIASHFMEHLFDFIGVMNECWRILRKEGILYVIVPHKDSEKALVPSHTRLFDKWTFDFFQYNEYAKNYHSRLWEVKELVVNERPDIHVKMTPHK